VVLNDLSGLTERISLLQEEISARQMEKSNRTLYTLTVITVLALPINIVAGFFGMNVGGSRWRPIITGLSCWCCLSVDLPLGPDIWPSGGGTICEPGSLSARLTRPTPCGTPRLC
jgi:hypothetical protein